MRLSFIVSVFFLAGLVFGGSYTFATSVANYPEGVPTTGLGQSRHNMSSFGQVIYTNGTSEECAFCHTPHHSNTSVSPAPLWNRANSPTAVYKAYGATLAGSNSSAVGSVSLACLSCHDGVTAFDSLVNPPGGAARGTAGVYPAGQEMNWRFYMAGYGLPLASSVHKFDVSAASPCVVCHVSFFGIPAPVYRLATGTDLTNSHPVSIAYNPAVSTSLRDKSTLLSSIDLVTGLAAGAGQSFNNNLSQNRWAVNGFISNTATIQDLLKNNKVECSSCHDPHFKNLSWDEVKPQTATGAWCTDPERCADGGFLRRVGGNTGSAMCRTCHKN